MHIQAKKRKEKGSRISKSAHICWDRPPFGKQLKLHPFASPADIDFGPGADPRAQAYSKNAFKAITS